MVAWTIRNIRPHEVDAARRLLIAGGWEGNRVEPAQFGTLVANARAAVVAVHEDRVVGFARVLGDGVSNGYLSMLVVDEGFRGKGIGRALVEHVMGSDPNMTWVLRARSDVRAFYEKLGFSASMVAMERVRRTDATEKPSVLPPSGWHLP